jgi:geranylgeranyl reductase family protein
MKRFDVIVVGAGPAGATAARHCSIQSLKTLLLEKERLPRYKVCAGGVTATAYKELGFTLPKRIIERECRGLRFCVKGFEKDIRDNETIIYMVKRNRFDEYLVGMAKKEGVEVHDAEACTSVSIEDKGVRVDTILGSYAANIVIGADGFYSRILKSMRRRTDNVRYCVLCEIPMDEAGIDEKLGDLALIHFGFVDRGYAWLFPKKRYITAGVGGAFPRSKELHERLKGFLKAHNLSTKESIKGWFIPITSLTHPVYAERIMLVGDAAGFVDALTGEGIASAVMSGKLAAATARACYEKGNFSEDVLSEYQTRCLERFGDTLTYASGAVDYLLKYPDLILGAIARDHDALYKYMKTLKGELDYKSYSEWFKRRMPSLLLKKIFTL